MVKLKASGQDGRVSICMSAGQVLPFNSPNQWLRDAIQQAQCSIHALGRELCLSAPQISHWLKGRETIPRHHLIQLADLLAPRDGAYVGHLKDCEELVGQVGKTLRDFAGQDEPLVDFIESCICEKMCALLDQELDSTPGEHAAAALRFLSAALFVLRRAVSLRDDPTRPLVSQQNIHAHLRYPHNHLVGLFMDLPSHPRCRPEWKPLLSSFRQDALRSLRRSIPIVTDAPIPSFVRHHAVHLLARHGDPTDTEQIKRFVYARKGDAMQRRLAYAGLSLTGTHPEVAEQFLRDLRADESLRLANLHFDALHYGDTLLDDAGQLSLAQSLPNTVTHILRHLLSPRQYSPIQTVEEQTLSDILALLGDESFLDPKTRRRLKHLPMSLDKQARSHSLSPRVIALATIDP